MQKLIRFLGTFVPVSELEKFVFTTTAEARQAASLEVFDAIENGAGFGVWKVSEV